MTPKKQRQQQRQRQTATATATADSSAKLRNDKKGPVRMKKEKVGLVLAAVEVGFDFGDGIEALWDEIGVGDFYVELLLEAGD